MTSSRVPQPSTTVHTLTHNGNHAPCTASRNVNRPFLPYTHNPRAATCFGPSRTVRSLLTGALVLCEKKEEHSWRLADLALRPYLGRWRRPHSFLWLQTNPAAGLFVLCIYCVFDPLRGTANTVDCFLFCSSVHAIFMQSLTCFLSTQLFIERFGLRTFAFWIPNSCAFSPCSQLLFPNAYLNRFRCFDKRLIWTNTICIGLLAALAS